jgi:hypothetical protein
VKRVLWLVVIAVACVGTVGQLWGEASAKCRCERAQVKELEGALAPNFYLEGNAIPTQKRNAAMLKCDCGKRMVFALLDTSGYSADVQQKYHGMALVEDKTTLGTAALEVGAYGFGIEKPVGTSEQPARIIFYNIGGKKVGETVAPYDSALAQPVPLQIATSKDQPERLYLGRYWLEIR